MRGKKGIDVFYSGPEYLTILVLILGVVMGLITQNSFVDILIIFLIGLMLGRTLYKHSGSRKFTLMMITVGFFLGYSLGAHKTSWKILLIFFIAGSVLSYQVHKKGIILD